MEELKHYGVPGMKWGVRRAQRKENRSIKNAKRIGEMQKRMDEHHNKAMASLEKQQKLQAVRPIGQGGKKLPKEEKQLYEDYKKNIKEVYKLDNKAAKLANKMYRTDEKAVQYLEKFSNAKIRTLPDGRVVIDL